MKEETWMISTAKRSIPEAPRKESHVEEMLCLFVLAFRSSASSSLPSLLVAVCVGWALTGILWASYCLNTCTTCEHLQNPSPIAKYYVRTSRRPSIDTYAVSQSAVIRTLYFNQSITLAA